MPRDSHEIGTPLDWIRRARSNLARAKQPRTQEIFLEDLCFDSQQAAEKSLKALLLSRGIPFRFVHDISELLTLLEKNNVTLPDEIRAAADLTNYAVESRYPGPVEPVTEEEYKEALCIAEAVVAWAESKIKNE